MNAISKPRVGDPCNGCGLCCQRSVCTTGSHVLGLVDVIGVRADGPCPALVVEDGTFQCGLFLRPKDFIESNEGAAVLQAAIGLLIGAGAGCDDVGDDPSDEAERRAQAVADTHLARHDPADFESAVIMLHLHGRPKRALRTQTV